MRYRYLLPAFVTMLAWQCAFTQPALLPIQEFIGTWNQGFGNHVVGLSDMNGDGKPDFGISSYGESKFYLYFGGKDVLDTEPDAVLPGGVVAVAGDFNGDGMRDLVLTKRATSDLPDMDTVFIFFGKRGPGLGIDLTSPVLIAGEARSAGFGYSMAVGDLNRDGYDDLVIGASTQGDPIKRIGGKVFIYMGKPFFDGIPDFTGMTGDYGATTQFGSNLQIADVNGDSYPDIVVSAHFNRMNHPDSVWQRLYIYRGGPAFAFDATKPNQLIESRRFDFGDVRYWSLDHAKVMDFNNDGLADVCVRHKDWWNLRVFVFLAIPDSIKLYPEIFIEKPPGMEGFYWDAGKYPGDINADGHKDFAFRCFPVPGPISRLIFYQGANRGFVPFPFASSQFGPTNYYGSTIALVGDQNGDGVDDIGVNTSNSNTSNGGAIILAGNRNLPVGIEVIDNIARDPTIHSAYPNPFHAYTNITIENEQPGNATVVVTDALGRVVRRVHEGELHAGKCSLRWDGTTDRESLAPSGVYFYRVIMGNEVTGGPLFLIRH